MTISKSGSYLTLQVRFLNGRLFNRLLAQDGRAIYSAEQGKILSALWRKSPQTATDIAIVTGLANNTLTQMLKKLEEKGLITSGPHPTDKRKRLFDLTDLGKSQEVVGNEVSRELDDIFYKGFSDQEIAQLDGYLERVVANLQEGLDRKDNK